MVTQSEFTAKLNPIGSNTSGERYHVIEILLERYRHSHSGINSCSRSNGDAKNLPFFDSLEPANSPIAAIVSCSDTRMEPSRVFELYPGEVFSIRNIANLVPIYSRPNYPCETAAGLEFAVKILRVPHIVVLGHSNCMGIHTMMELPYFSANDSEVDRWVRQVKHICEHLENISHRSLLETRKKNCEQASIRLSLSRLTTYPWIRIRVEANQLALHGWYYDFSEDLLFRFDLDGECFIRVDRITKAKSG